MPVADVLFLSMICVAFVGFGLILAWGDYQTRHLDPYAHKSDLSRERSGPTIIRQAKEKTHRPPAAAA
jgi:hypothetical protein